MATVDKNQAVITFLQTCPALIENPLFFNFGTVEDGAAQATVRSDDKALGRRFLDGSILKRYTFMLDNFRSVAYNPVVTNKLDENVDDLSTVQTILEWIDEQGNSGNFPEFGDECIIEKMETLTERPDLVGVDTSLNPPMAIYRISIQIDYIDNSKRIWN